MVKIRRQQADTFQIDVAPLVDVLFTLLIFFSLTSSFVQDQGIQINLPEASSSGSLENQKRIEIFITVEGKVVVDTETLTTEQLRELLEKIDNTERSGYLVVLKADTLAVHGYVTTVLDMVKGMSFKNIAIATKAQK